MNQNDKYYILIGQDQLATLNKWYKIEILREKFSFIVSKRGNEGIDNSVYENDNKFIFIEHPYKDISSKLIKQGKYHYTMETITNYILNYNLYIH